MHRLVFVLLSLALVSAGCEPTGSLESGEYRADQKAPPPLPVLVHTAYAKADGGLSYQDARILVQSLAAENGQLAPLPKTPAEALATLEPLVGGGALYSRHADITRALADEIQYAGKAVENAPKGRALVTVLVSQPNAQQWNLFAEWMNVLSETKTLSELVLANNPTDAYTTALLGSAVEGVAPRFQIVRFAPTSVTSALMPLLQKGARLLRLQTPINNNETNSTVWMVDRNRDSKIVAIEGLQGAPESLLPEMKSLSWKGRKVYESFISGKDGATALFATNSDDPDAKNTWNIVAAPTPAGIDRDLYAGAPQLSYRGNGSAIWLRKRFKQKDGSIFSVYHSELAADHPKQLAEKAAPLLAKDWEPYKVFYRGPGAVAWFRCGKVLLPVTDLDTNLAPAERLARFTQGLADAFQAGCTSLSLFRDEPGVIAVFVKHPGKK